MLLFLTLALLPPAAVRGDESPAVAEPNETEITTEETPSADGRDSRSSGAMTLGDFEQIAFRHHPALAAATAQIHAARGQHLQAGLCPNPVAGYHATQIGNRGTSGQQGAFIRQRFITGGKLSLDQAIAAREISETQFQLQARQQQVLSDVRVRFYEALTAQRRVIVTQKLANIGDGIVEATQTLIEGRLGTENDLLQAEISAGQSHILLDNAVNSQEAAWRRLSAVSGVPGLEPTPLSGTLDDELMQLDWEHCRAEVTASHPELNAAQARVARAAVAIRRAKQEPVPDVELGVSVRSNAITTGNVVTNVELGVPVPVFDRNQGNICKAQAEWVAATHEARRIHLDLQDRLAVAFRRYANARQQVRRYAQTMLPKAQRSLTLVKHGYENGQVEYLTMLTAQQTYLQITLAWLDSLQELRTAASILEGQLLTDSLAPLQ